MRGLGDKPEFLENLRFSKHAMQRCNEFKIPIKKAKWMLYHSTKDEAPPDKYKKYPKQENINYWRNGTVLFCVGRVNDFKTGELIDLVMTVFDQRLYLSAEQLLG